MRGESGAAFVTAVAVVLVALTVAVYHPTLGHGFVWDDGKYLILNPRMAEGLTAENARWAFTTFYGSNWHPLTQISFLFDAKLFGMDPAGYHLVNLILHAAVSILLFLALMHLTGARMRSALVAALFAVHPLHVESVAWISERKDLLAAAMAFAALLFYKRYTLRPSVFRYLPVALFLLLGLMAKAIVVTFPFLLVLLDIWPLGRHSLRTIGSSLGEKIPLILLVVPVSAATFAAQAKVGAVSKNPLAFQLANAVVSYAAYLAKAIWPVDLAVFYPLDPARLAAGKVISSALLLLVISLALFMAKRPYLGVGWCWYLGTLVPVIGIVQVGSQAMADRHMYIPLVGLFIMAVWGLHEAGCTWRPLGRFLPVLAPLIVLLLAIQAGRQVRVWESNVTLFGHAVTVTSDNYLAHYNLGVFLEMEGREEEARPYYEEALRIRPDYEEAHVMLGALKYREGRMEEAMGHFRRAVEINSSFAPAYYYLGITAADEGRRRDAFELLGKAVTLAPDYVEARDKLGRLLAEGGRAGSALEHFREVVRMRPDSAMAHSNLGAALAELERYDEAITSLERARRLEPENSMIRANIERVLSETERRSEGK